MDEKDRAALKSLVVDNPCLEALEKRIGRFNLFEACGLVRQEIRHSNFLAFLLDPSESHGLGDVFLKGFLQETIGNLAAKGDPTFSCLDLHRKDLRASVVRREWRNIDILVENADHRLVVAIENKIGIGEHSDQLARYLDTLAREYACDWQKILLLLSPGAIAPSHGEYLAVGYATVHTLLAKTLDRLDTSLSPDIALALRHYKELLATHVIDDPELDKLCDDIYREHRRALDLIFARRAGPRVVLLDAAVDWIRSNSDRVFPDYVHRDIAKFVPRGWDAFSPVIGERDGVTLRSLCVMVRVEPNRVQIWIEMHRGPDEYRSRMQAIVDRDPRTFPTKAVRRHEINSVFFRKDILTGNVLATSSIDSLAERLMAALDAFIEKEVPALTAAFASGNGCLAMERARSA